MSDSNTNSNITTDNGSNAKTSAHKPVHYTKSSPSFHSMDYLGVHQQQFEESRSRSNSAPLSREALKVAKDLREASDMFLKAKRVRSRKRRRTLGSFMLTSIEKELIQAATVDEEEEEVLLGTPV